MGRVTREGEPRSPKKQKGRLDWAAWAGSVPHFKLSRTLETTTATKTRMRGKIPMFKNSLKLLAFLLVPVVVHSFCTKNARSTRIPMTAKDPARVTVETVEVVTVEIIAISLIVLCHYTLEIISGNYSVLTKMLSAS
jgi:hypothetical protein